MSTRCFTHLVHVDEAFLVHARLAGSCLGSCVCVSRASSLKRRCRPYKGTLTSPEGGGPFVRTGRQRSSGWT